MFRISSPAFLCFGFPFYRFLFVPLLRAIAIEHMIFSQTPYNPAFTAKNLCEKISRRDFAAHIRRNIDYPFTAPIVKPFTKYFCIKGYTRNMGRDANTVIVIRIPLGEIDDII